MSIAELLKVWREGQVEAEIHPAVFATRVRISRNLEERFVASLTDEERRLVRERIFSRLADCEALGGASYFSLEDLPAHERDFLCEATMLDGGLRGDLVGKGLVIAPDPQFSILVGEEDHIRIQSLKSGLQLDGAFAGADSLDATLEDLFDFAFSEEFGYLSASPQRAGTGLKVSALVHLPALALSDELPRVCRGLSTLHLSIEDPAGTDRPGQATLLEIANERCIGEPETAYLESIRSTINKLDEFELRARERLLAEARSLLEDRIWTAYGNLRYGRLMTYGRAQDLLGTLRLGILTEIIQDVSLQEVHSILSEIRDGQLQVALGSSLDEAERDSRRATMLREWLSPDDARDKERISSHER